MAVITERTLPLFPGMKNDETKELLLQQGLDDIAHSSTSEQIAYLLVERARLMDELEADQNQMQIDTPDGAMTAAQIYHLLEQERNDFEQELQVCDTATCYLLCAICEFL